MTWKMSISRKSKIKQRCGVLLMLVLTINFRELPGEQNVPNFAQSSSADSSKPATARKKSPTGAMLRSLVFPGCGQWYNGQKIKSALVFMGEGTLIGFAIYYNRKAEESPAGSQDQAFYQDRRNLMFWLMGGVTLLSMLDAYIDAYLYDFDTGPDLTLRAGFLNNRTGEAQSNSKLGISLRVNF